MTINAHINRHAWVGWLFIYLSELIFFSSYRLNNLSALVKISTTPDDTTPIRIYGVLLGLVQDFVVISFLILVLSVFDAAINHSCCNDTAPNGCTDCFARGILFRSRTKLMFKRLLRLSLIFAVCLLSVSVFAMDVVTVRSYHRRYEFSWNSDDKNLVVTKEQERKTATNVLVTVLVTQGIIAMATTVWFDLSRWTPLRFEKRWESRVQRYPTVNISRPPVNYLVMDSNDFFDSDENEDLSSFFDSSNRPIRGTQRPQSPAILSEDRRDLPPSRLTLVVFGFGLALVSFNITPLLVLLIMSYCPPAVASIALNSISTSRFAPSQRSRSCQDDRFDSSTRQLHVH